MTSLGYLLSNDTGEHPAMFSLLPRSWFVLKAGWVEAIPAGRL